MDWSTNYFPNGGDTTEPIFVWDQTTEPPSAGQWSFNTILTVVLSVVIVVLVVSTIVALCCYCIVRRNRAKNTQTTNGQVVYVDSNTGQQTVRTPVTRQIVEIFSAKKNKKQPVAVASTTPLEHAQVSVLNHVKEGGQYDVSISNISQQAIIATAAPQPEPQPVVDVPVPLPAPNPTPRPHPGTTIYTVGNEQVTPPPPPPPPPAPEPDLGPAVYNVPVAAYGNHGYTIQAAAFDIPQPTPAPIFMAHHHHSATNNQSLVSQPSLFVAPQTQPPVPAAPQPYMAPPLPVAAQPYMPAPPPPGQPQQYFAPPQPVPLPLGLPQQTPMPYSPPSLGYPAPQPTYNPGFSFNGTLPSVYPVATQVADAASTYGGGQGYAVSLPNISVQPGGGGGVNMGYTVHQ